MFYYIMGLIIDALYLLFIAVIELSIIRWSKYVALVREMRCVYIWSENLKARDHFKHVWEDNIKLNFRAVVH